MISALDLNLMPQATMSTSISDSSCLPSIMIFLQPSPALAARDTAYLVEPPPGEVRTFGSDRPTLAPGLVVFGCASTAVAGMAVLLRIYTRTFVVRNAVSTDDCELMLGFMPIGADLQTLPWLRSASPSHYLDF